MARCKRDRDEIGYFLPKFIRYGFIGLLSVVLLSESVGAKGTLAQLQIAQQTVPAPSVPLSPDKQQRYQEGVKLYQEGKELQKKETKEGYQQAIEKYQQALKIVQELGLRQKEVEILVYIGGAYNSISEEETALNYLQQALDKAQGLKPSYKAWILGLFTLIYSDMGRLDDAINSFKQTELIFLQQTKIEPDELGSLASSYKSIATVYNRKGEPEKAFYYLDKALKIYRDTLKSTDGEASVLEDIGFIHSLRGETSKAFEKYNQALAIFEKISNLPAQAQILSHIASLHRKMGKYQQAMKNLYIAQKLLEGVEGTLFQQGFIVSNIADVHAISGDYKAAIPYYQQAINLYYKSGDTNLALLAFINISNMYKFSGEYQKALEYLNKGLKLPVDNKDGQALILQQNASIYSLQSDYQNALEEYNKALNIQRSIPRPTSEANTLKQIGLLYKSLGDYQSSINHYTKALDIYKKIGDKPQQAITHGLIASVYDASKNYDEALKSYEQALLLLNKEDYQSEILTLRNMVRTYNSLKNYPKALETAQRAFSLSKGKGKNEEFKTLNILAEVYDSNGNYQKALETYQTILPYFRQARLRFDEADILNQIGRTYTLSNQYQLAINTYNEELKLRRVFKNGTDEADALYSIAKNQRKLGKLETALTNIDEAIKIVEKIRGNVKNPDLRTSYFATVQGYYKFYIDLLMELDKKNPGKNYDALALNISEKSRARVLLELLTEANAKIRKGAKPELLQKESDLLQQIDAREALLQKQKSGNQKDALVAESIKKLETDLENLRNQYQQLQISIRESSPKYANLKYPQPLNLQQIQQQLDKDTVLLQYSIGSDRSYLWAVTPTSLNTYQLPGKKIIDLEAKKFRTGISSPELLPEVIQYANNFSKILLGQVADKIKGKRLVIVADGALQTIPFAALPDINPNPPQANVETRNFASLQNPNVATKQTQKLSLYQPLMVNHEIVNLPSASTIAIQRQELRKPAPKQIAILADPVYSSKDCRFTSPDPNCKDDDSKFERQIKQNSQPQTKSSINPELEIERSTLERSAKNLNRNGFFRLPNTAIEAKTILDIFKSFSKSPNSIEALNFDANFDWVTNPALNQFRILHFATHGFADEENPENSGIVLSQFDQQRKPIRGFLRLGDLFNQDYPADLIVLSACQTGLGKEVNGEGLVGLTRGLMYAGASRVAVSLWNVNDEGTSVLMREFYKEMLQGNKTPAAAMRAAQIKLWSNAKWRNPFYWAAFTVSGEWREE